ISVIRMSESLFDVLRLYSNREFSRKNRESFDTRRKIFMERSQFSCTIRGNGRAITRNIRDSFYSISNYFRLEYRIAAVVIFPSHGNQNGSQLIETAFQEIPVDKI